MKIKSYVLFFICSIMVMGLAAADDYGFENPAIPHLNPETSTSSTNTSTANVNNSIYWDGHAFVVGAVSSIEIDPDFNAWLGQPPDLSEFNNDLGFINSSEGNSTYIKLDGTSTTTAVIPFAQGISLGASKNITWDANTYIKDDQNITISAGSGKIILRTANAGAFTFEDYATGVKTSATSPAGDAWNMGNDLRPTVDGLVGGFDLGVNDVGGEGVFRWRNLFLLDKLQILSDTGKIWLGADGASDYDIYFNGTAGLFGKTNSKDTYFGRDIFARNVNSDKINTGNISAENITASGYILAGKDIRAVGNIYGNLSMNLTEVGSTTSFYVTKEILQTGIYVPQLNGITQSSPPLSYLALASPLFVRSATPQIFLANADNTINSLISQDAVGKLNINNDANMSLVPAGGHVEFGAGGIDSGTGFTLRTNIVENMRLYGTNSIKMSLGNSEWNAIILELVAGDTSNVHMIKAGGGNLVLFNTAGATSKNTTLDICGYVNGGAGKCASMGINKTSGNFVVGAKSVDILNTEVQNNFIADMNVTVGSLLKLTSITLPTCASGLDGSIARNTTGIYYCNSTTWRQFNFV